MQRAFPVVMAFILPRSDASFIMGLLSGSNSVVECDLAKVEVAGSNPVSRSIAHGSWCPLLEGPLHVRQRCWHRWTFLASGATLISGRGTQVVRERSAKPLCVGSIPTRASRNISCVHKGPQPFSPDSIHSDFRPTINGHSHVRPRCSLGSSEISQRHPLTDQRVSSPGTAS